MWNLIVPLAIFALEFTSASRILVVFPVPSKSHGILGDGFVKTLLEAGHEVTYITPFIVKEPHPRLYQVDVSDKLNDFKDDIMNIKKIMDGQDTFSSIFVLYEISLHVATRTIQNENVQNLMRDPNQNFDLIIAEWMFTEIYAGLSSVFNAPFIWSSSMEPHWMALQLIDDIPNPSYNNDFRSSNVAPFSFLARVQELGVIVFGTVIKEIYMEPKENAIYNDVFGPAATLRGRKLTPLNVIKYNASLMFGNSHVSLGEATRLPQNYKPIAGYHLDTNVKPLPEGLKNVIESSKDGVIYFSMGSGLKSKDWPEELKRDLLKMFGKFKQTILWKFEEDLVDRPKNVHILKWAPQPSILAHPNVRLFITHGGLLSTTESVHFGKPIIGIPVFGDQFINVGRAVNKGFAVKVDLTYNIVSDLKAAIQEVLNNSKYIETVKERSYIYYDRPVTPAKELAHWAEHVIKTNGAPHLRSPALLVPWYQKIYLDLAALVAAAIYVIMWVLRTLCKKNKSADSVKKLD